MGSDLPAEIVETTGQASYVVIPLDMDLLARNVHDGRCGGWAPAMNVTAITSKPVPRGRHHPVQTKDGPVARPGSPTGGEAVRMDAATIAIVDDVPEVRLLVRTHLQESGAFRVVGEGADGMEAVELAHRHRPSLLLLDISMPRLDGLEALPRVLAASPSTCVVMYSGLAHQGLLDRARRLGAAAAIEKSTPLDSLGPRLLAVLPTEEAAGGAGSPVAASPVAATQRGRPRDEQSVLEEHVERFRDVFEWAAVGMATLTLTGRLMRVNHALETLMQQPAAALVGLSYGELTDDAEELVAATLEDIHRRPSAAVQFDHKLAATVDHRRVRATLASVRDSRGRPLYLFLHVQDITAEREATEERTAEGRFRLLVQAVEDYAIFMLDPSGHVVSWNRGAQRIKGYTAEEILGQHFRVFYPPEAKEEMHPEYELQVALREGHYEEEGWRVRKDGSQFWADVLITAAFDDSGAHIGFAKVTRDITERRRLGWQGKHLQPVVADTGLLHRRLTRREVEVLRLVARGLNNREIGEGLFISEHTAKNHVQNILGKLQMHSRLAAATYAIRTNLLSGP